MGKLSFAGQTPGGEGGGILQASWARSSGYRSPFRAGHGVTSSQHTGPRKHLVGRCLPAPFHVTAWGSSFCDSQDAEEECGSTGQSRAERGMGLPKGKCCPQAASDVRSSVQEEERLVQVHGREFPPSCGFCVENLDRNTAQAGACLGNKGKELQAPLCSFS